MIREEAIDLLDNLIGAVEDNHGSDYDEALKIAIKALKQEPKTGHWIKNEGSLYCSFCGCGALYDKVYTGESVFGKTIRADSTFCPTCGAKMTAESEDK